MIFQYFKDGSLLRSHAASIVCGSSDPTDSYALEAWERMTNSGVMIDGDLTTPDPHHYTPRLRVSWCPVVGCSECYRPKPRTRGCVVELTHYHAAC